jgi:hypothetical protein
MFDHTHVHSCFGILSSFDLRISSFTQAFGFPPNPPATPRDAGTTQRDRSGLIGTALGHEKDGFLSPLADASGRINTLRTASYVSGPRNHTPPNIFFSRVPSTTLNAGAIHTLRHCGSNGITVVVRASSLHCNSHRDRLPWGDFGEILATLWPRFLSTPSIIHRPITRFQENLYATHPPHHRRQTFSSSRRPQPRPPLPLALRSWLRRPNLHPPPPDLGFSRVLRQMLCMPANTELQPNRGVPSRRSSGDAACQSSHGGGECGHDH